jgi:hypothetical protein
VGGPEGQAGDNPLDWVPAAARDYIAHIEDGRTIRAIARDAQVHPSTISRRVRRVEASRDDPLVDAALRNLSSSREPEDAAPPDPPGPAPAVAKVPSPTPPRPLPVSGANSGPAPSATAAAVPRLPAASVEGRALPMLRRLSEPGTLLAVARDMENGVLLREGPEGEPQRLAVVARELAEAMALHEWIAGADPGARIRRYLIAPAGRSLLRRATAEAAQGLAEAPAAFIGAESVNDPRLRHMRSLLAESPLVTLARRRNGEGRAFLSKDHVAAGERLREDFEAAMQGGIEVPWDEVLKSPASFVEASPRSVAGAPGGQHRPLAALARVARALEVLGPGLADVALGCCALLEGLEVLERRLGWSSRSGKVVLRIALDRLRRHYQDEEARGGSLIG